MEQLLTKWAHITHLKPLLQADEIIENLSKEDAFDRKTKFALNPDKIPDLDWKRTTKLNTPITQYHNPTKHSKEGEGKGKE